MTKQCCGYGGEGAYCAECCDNSDCYMRADLRSYAKYCERTGFCTTPECCYDTSWPRLRHGNAAARAIALTARSARMESAGGAARPGMLQRRMRQVRRMLPGRRRLLRSSRGHQQPVVTARSSTAATGWSAARTGTPRARSAPNAATTGTARRAPAAMRAGATIQTRSATTTRTARRAPAAARTARAPVSAAIISRIRPSQHPKPEPAHARYWRHGDHAAGHRRGSERREERSPRRRGAGRGRRGPGRQEDARDARGSDRGVGSSTNQRRSERGPPTWAALVAVAWPGTFTDNRRTSLGQIIYVYSDFG